MKSRRMERLFDVTAWSFVAIAGGTAVMMFAGMNHEEQWLSIDNPAYNFLETNGRKINAQIDDKIPPDHPISIAVNDGIDSFSLAKDECLSAGGPTDVYLCTDSKTFDLAAWTGGKVLDAAGTVVDLAAAKIG